MAASIVLFSDPVFPRSTVYLDRSEMMNDRIDLSPNTNSMGEDIDWYIIVEKEHHNDFKHLLHKNCKVIFDTEDSTFDCMKMLEAQYGGVKELLASSNVEWKFERW
ncbi:MAG: hypothetical protein ABJO30_15170 [Hyphomicrobiales bacterium]